MDDRHDDSSPAPTDDRAHASDPGAPFAEAEEFPYFRALEEALARVRGTSVLVSPRDYEIARRWFALGIPVDVVERTLVELFAKRRERGAKGTVSSLRYAASAVEVAWEEIREMSALGELSAAVALDVPARLEALAESIRRAVPAASAIGARVRALTGGSEEVEWALAALDGELIAAAESAAPADAVAGIAEEVDASLARLASRLPAAEIERGRERLRQQVVRRRLCLPLLSLFSPDAEPGRAGASSAETTERHGEG